jgi:hypothetical protein
VFGGLALKDFALALFVGLLTGAYSSIFVATPLLAWLKEKEPKYTALRARSAADLAKAEKERAAEARRAPVVPPPVEEEAIAASALAVATELEAESAADGGDLDDDADPDVTISAPDPSLPGSPTATRGAAAPRGRQQRRKKRK